ncbi:Ig-like domain-containing protein [Flammeovirga sp. EKP202]|uniref:Ig-like domain-containing protein n=1 Tax=Flammeovirga sp. EKP202 TaxID=2770592 RepID=UPI00165F2A74|nr:Ig-like domain-containing protein [Flammeovirga sp. EKP202]MBD0405196.1 Ig-like domain-containing protein [Flammeovirga sp. EKP202]
MKEYTIDGAEQLPDRIIKISNFNQEYYANSTIDSMIYKVVDSLENPVKNCYVVVEQKQGHAHLLNSSFKTNEEGIGHFGIRFSDQLDTLRLMLSIPQYRKMKDIDYELYFSTKGNIYNSKMHILEGNYQNYHNGAHYRKALRVVLKDQYNNPIDRQKVYFKRKGSDEILFETTTDKEGIASMGGSSFPGSYIEAFSDHSDTATFTLFGGGFPHLSSHISDGEIVVQWDKYEGENFKSFTVERNDGVVIAEVFDQDITSVIDNSPVVIGKKYTYKVILNLKNKDNAFTSYWINDTIDPAVSQHVGKVFKRYDYKHFYSFDKITQKMYTWDIDEFKVHKEFQFNRVIEDVYQTSLETQFLVRTENSLLVYDAVSNSILKELKFSDFLGENQGTFEYAYGVASGDVYVFFKEEKNLFAYYYYDAQLGTFSGRNIYGKGNEYVAELCAEDDEYVYLKMAGYESYSYRFLGTLITEKKGKLNSSKYSKFFNSNSLYHPQMNRIYNTNGEVHTLNTLTPIYHQDYYASFIGVTKDLQTLLFANRSQFYFIDVPSFNLKSQRGCYVSEHIDGVFFDESGSNVIVVSNSVAYKTGV